MHGFEAFFWNFIRMAVRDGQFDWCMHHRLVRMYELLPDLRDPMRILQIGRGEGGGELLLSILFPSATVFSIDNEEVKPLPHLLRLTEALDRRPVVYVADSASSEAIAFAREHAPFELLIIDGCHHDGYPLLDFRHYAPMIQGYVVFDDYSAHFPEVETAVERIALSWPCVRKDPDLGLALFAVDGSGMTCPVATPIVDPRAPGARFVTMNGEESVDAHDTPSS